MGWCCCLFLVILIGCVLLSLPKPGEYFMCDKNLHVACCFNLALVVFLFSVSLTSRDDLICVSSPDSFILQCLKCFQMYLITDVAKEMLKQFLSSSRTPSPSSSSSSNKNKYNFKEHLMSGETLGCYTCESRSGSDRRCDDGSYTASYQESCVPREAGMSQGFGIFPHYCSKIVGLDMTTNSYVTIRGCSQRYRNECKSPILVNGRAIDGCIYSCSGKYCNSSSRSHVSFFVLLMTLFVSMTTLLSSIRLKKE